ncbi:unnamed protein product [Nezara viridula]|uniref:Alkaline phosphatase n=1 Tax=Nezara viridula TaxID=85310 RepID=A0A9P0HQN8_NEZVI|nr:unnamed protein product [Nezara viridula]
MVLCHFRDLPASHDLKLIRYAQSLTHIIRILNFTDRAYWEKSAKADLEDGLKTRLNTDVAKNVIIFVGDGMGPNTITASRIYRGGETSYLSWERFPHFGALKTYAENKQVPDSASTATAMFTGVKVNYRMLGVDSSVKERDCEGSLMAEKRLTSIAKLAQQAGKATGIVTTTRVTHATPAAMYAHSAYRHWECDSNIPKNSNCKDIARQLIEDAPGKNFNVEGGMIDLAHHRGKARKALHEVLAFNDAINATMKLLKDSGIVDETLVIVTSDHSHTLTISGYPNRGNNILGIASVSRLDGLPYTTLGYANSAKENYHYKVENNSVVREDPSKVDTTSFDYGVQAGVLQDENTHGGRPFAHLFHHMHEQNYVAEVVKYAAKLGEYNSFYNTTDKINSASTSGSFPLMTALSLIFITFLSVATL